MSNAFLVKDALHKGVTEGSCFLNKKRTNANNDLKLVVQNKEDMGMAYIWGERILEARERFDITKATMADRLGTSAGNLGSYIAGRVELPVVCKIRLCDMNAYRSKIEILKLVLEDEFEELMGMVTLVDVRDPARGIPSFVLEQIRVGGEKAAWVKILDIVKGPDSDMQLAARIGTTRSLISVIRTLDKRLTRACKMECLKSIKPEVTLDELYLIGASLLRQEGLDLLLESEKYRSNENQAKSAVAWAV